jgi:hypothetical protein
VGVSGVGSEGPRETGTYRAVCAGVGVNTLHKNSHPEIAGYLLLLNSKNTVGSANARGSGSSEGDTPPRKRRIQCERAEFDVCHMDQYRCCGWGGQGSHEGGVQIPSRNRIPAYVRHSLSHRIGAGEAKAPPPTTHQSESVSNPSSGAPSSGEPVARLPARLT